MKPRFLLAVTAALALVATQAATFTVTTSDDSGPGSLRQAILDANASPGDDAIVFTTNGTIVLSSPLPLITGNTVVAGPGTNQLTISGNNAVQVFSFNAGTTNTISGLTIANGMATNYASGAGISNAGSLTIMNCTFINNQTFGGWGGAVFNSGGLAISNSMFSGNQVTGDNGSPAYGGGGGAAGMGGALFSISGTANISGCSFIANEALGGNGSDAHINNSYGGRGGGVNGGSGGTSPGTPGQPGGFGGGGGCGARGAGTSGYPGQGGQGGFGGGGGGGGAPASASGNGNIGGQGGFGGGVGGQGGIAFGSNVESGGGGGGAGLGGAIFAVSGTVTILDCWFTGNPTTGGGAGGGANAATTGSGVVGSVFTSAATVVLQNSVVNVVSPTTPYETWTYGGVQRLAPIGTPAVFADGQFLSGNVTKEGSVQMSFETSFAGGTIFYSLDGSDPAQTPQFTRGHSRWGNQPIYVLSPTTRASRLLLKWTRCKL